MRRTLQGIGQDLGFDLWRDTVGVRVARTASLLDERGDAAGLEGSTHLVEGVAVVAHDFAGFGDVAEFLGEMKQRQLSSGTLSECGHLGISRLVGGLAITNLTGDPGDRTSRP